MSQVESKGIRTSDVCRKLQAEGVIIPDLLKDQVEYMCDIASLGDPNFLEPSESAMIDEASYPNYFEGYEGVEDFAKTIKKMTYVPSYHIPSNIFYEGFANEPIEEPPYAVNGFTIDKVAHDLESGAITFIINGFIKGVIYPDQKFYLRKEDNSTFLVIAYEQSDLPFMPAYNQSVELNAHNASFAVEPPNTTIHEAGSKGLFDYDASNYFLDNAGRIFYFNDEDKDPSDFNNIIPSVDTMLNKFQNAGMRKYDAPDIYSAITYFNFAEGLKTRQQYFDEHYKPSYGGFGCFAGNTLLKTESGNTITFDELYEMYERGDELPLIQAWDPVNSEWTYQTPMSVQKHVVTNEQELVKLCYETAEKQSKCTVQVTPNHFMRVRRFNNEFWMPVGDISTDDELKTGDGWVKVGGKVQVYNTKEFAVYNLTFDQRAGDYGNYAVSDSGSEWLIAHNKPY